MNIFAKAPCRVDMAGGTIDIWPLYLFHSGAVTVNFAVNRYASCRSVLSDWCGGCFLDRFDANLAKRHSGSIAI